MKKVMILLFLFSVTLLACAPVQAPVAQDTQVDVESAGNSVTIENFAFAPATLMVKKGATVTWTNQDSAPHTVTSDNGSELNSGSLSKGQSYSHTFNEAGTFEYHCKFHSMMKAKVIVE